MNTFMKKLGVLAAMLSTFLSASAFEVNGIYYDITDPTAKEVEVTKVSSDYSGDIVVPSSVSYDGDLYTVASIGDRAFSYCSSLASITLPNSVTSIGVAAFSYCSSLTSITLPNTVTSIGDVAFYGCSSLTSITLPNSVTSIGDLAFWGCSSLTSITIPNSVTSIGDRAFSGCSSLTSITLPNSVKFIGDLAFRGCSSLTSIDVDVDNQTYSSNDGILYDKLQTTLICCPGGKSEEVTIPNSVTSIGGWAFRGCRSLTSITLPNSVTSIGVAAFSDCSSLTSIDVDVDNEGYSSNNGILYDKLQTTLICCPGGKSEEVTIPNSVTSIGGWAFRGCRSLTSITLPNSVTSIGEGAFSDCSSLASITIPNSVTSIGEGAFSGGSSLTSIDVDVDNQTYSSNDGILYDKLQTTLICCPGGKSEEVIIPNTVTSIGKGAFEGCSSLTSITLPNTVTSIGDYAFCDCSSLTSITSLAVTPPYCDDIYVFYEVDKQNCTLYVPAGSVEAYKQAPEWKDFWHVEVVEAGIDSVAAGTADGATEVFNLTGVKVADSLVNLPSGIYLVRKGSTVRKIAVR